jgi:hypothetical protein
MKPWRSAGGALTFCVVTLLVVAAAPAVLLFGELVNRHYRRGLPPGPGRERAARRRGARAAAAAA